MDILSTVAPETENGSGRPWYRHEESHVEYLRRLIEAEYEEHPTGTGASFGELLCHEIHSNGMTFAWLAEKWGVSLSVLGELIADHCRRLEPLPNVDHEKGRPA